MRYIVAHCDTDTLLLNTSQKALRMNRVVSPDILSGKFRKFYLYLRERFYSKFFYHYKPSK